MTRRWMQPEKPPMAPEVEEMVKKFFTDDELAEGEKRSRNSSEGKSAEDERKEVEEFEWKVEGEGEKGDMGLGLEYDEEFGRPAM